MSSGTEPSAGLSQRTAEILGRQINSAATNAHAYGVDHPVADRALSTLLDALQDALQVSDPLTLMLDRGSFFIEDHQVDARFNARRLALVFRSLDLQSITFSEGLDHDGLTRLVTILSSPDDYAGIDELRSALAERAGTSIRVNHIVLRKFTEDDEVIARDGLEELTDLAEQAVSRGAGHRDGAPSDEPLMERVEQVFSLAGLVRSPDRVAGELIESAGPEGRLRPEIAARIREIGNRVADGRGTESGETVPPDQLMDALVAMRQQLSESLAGQEELTRLMGESGGVLDEVDRLTCSTIVSIVREEMRAGEASPQRLAQIIRRVLPDASDLKRLLPMLKQGLLEEGMQLGEYIQFVNELTGELQDEGVVQALEAGAESIGLGVDEIVREIRRDPGEAARLLVLASELRQAGRADEDKLSEALTEYIERISGELALEDPGGDVTDGKALREAVRERQRSLVSDLRAQGVSGSVADRVEAALGKRLDDSTGSLRSSRLIDLLSQSESLADPDVAERLARIVERESNLRTLGDTVQRELESHGYSTERIDAIYNETLARLRRRNRIEFVPGSVMNPGATGYFLQREIATAVRYGTVVSCIMLMIAQVRDPDGDWRTISTEEIEALMPQVFDILPSHLRDLDLLGTLGSKDRNIPLAILPMTEVEGAEAVKDRMLTALEHAHLELSSVPVKINVLGSALQFDPDKASDSKSFVQAMKGRLASQLVTALRSR